MVRAGCKQASSSLPSVASTKPYRVSPLLLNPHRLPSFTLTYLSRCLVAFPSLFRSSSPLVPPVPPFQQTKVFSPHPFWILGPIFPFLQPFQVFSSSQSFWYFFLIWPTSLQTKASYFSWVLHAHNGLTNTQQNHRPLDSPFTSDSFHRRTKPQSLLLAIPISLWYSLHASTQPPNAPQLSGVVLFQRNEVCSATLLKWPRCPYVKAVFQPSHPHALASIGLIITP